VLGNYHRRKPSIMRRPALLIGLELLSGDSTMLYKLRQETTTIGEIMCSSNHDPETSSGGSQFPRIHVSVMVLEGSDSHILRVADGHVPGTALPGRFGNVGIAGHRDTFFRPLREIRSMT